MEEYWRSIHKHTVASSLFSSGILKKRCCCGGVLIAWAQLLPKPQSPETPRMCHCAQPEDLLVSLLRISSPKMSLVFLVLVILHSRQVHRPEDSRQMTVSASARCGSNFLMQDIWREDVFTLKKSIESACLSLPAPKASALLSTGSSSLQRVSFPVPHIYFPLRSTLCYTLNANVNGD